MHSAPEKSRVQKSFTSAECPKKLFKHSGITDTWLSGSEWQPNAKHSTLKHCMKNRGSCLRDQSKFPTAQKDKRFQIWSFLFFKEVNILDMTGPSKRSRTYKEWENTKSLENLSNNRKLTWLLFFLILLTIHARLLLNILFPHSYPHLYLRTIQIPYSALSLDH